MPCLSSFLQEVHVYFQRSVIKFYFRNCNFCIISFWPVSLLWTVDPDWPNFVKHGRV